MNLRFYNSFSREMEDLRPRKARHLGIYVCGPDGLCGTPTSVTPVRR